MLVSFRTLSIGLGENLFVYFFILHLLRRNTALHLRSVMTDAASEKRIVKLVKLTMTKYNETDSVDDGDVGG